MLYQLSYWPKFIRGTSTRRTPYSLTREAP